MRKIKVVYYNVDKPNKNNHLYKKDLLDCALSKFCEQDFWVVREPAEAINLADVVGRVSSSVWDENNLSFYITLYSDDIDISKDYFCLFGFGNIFLENINNEITTIENFDLTGMFIADSCAWEYSVELLEEESQYE